MMRFGQIEIITVGFIIMTSLATPAGAGISWSGHVTPSDPSTWDSSTRGYIGNFLDGTMDITAGSDVIDDYGFIGSYPGVTGAVTVDGVGSTWTHSRDLVVGEHSNGTLDITNGGAVGNNDGLIGFWDTSMGEVTVDGSGSTWTNRDDLRVGYLGDGMLNITGGGLVSVAGLLTIDNNGDDDSFINMATGGKLALFGGDADDLLVDFMELIEGTDAIRYWAGSGWADIMGASLGLDYTLEYVTQGDLAGYTMLTVPEPATMLLFGLGGVLLRKRS